MRIGNCTVARLEWSKETVWTICSQPISIGKVNGARVCVIRKEPRGATFYQPIMQFGNVVELEEFTTLTKAKEEAQRFFDEWIAGVVKEEAQ